MRDKEEKKVEEEAKRQWQDSEEDTELTDKMAAAAKIAEGAMGDMLGSVGMDFGQMISSVQEFFADFEERQIKMNNMLVNLRKGQKVIVDNQKDLLRVLGSIESDCQDVIADTLELLRRSE